MKKEVLAVGLMVAATLGSLASRAHAALPVVAAPTPAERHWFKGNLHTHSLWSDGNNYPEMIADWYKAHGYQFLVLSEHNTMQTGEHWLPLRRQLNFYQQRTYELGGEEILTAYCARFGDDWVQRRVVGETREVRLKPLDEYRALLEEPNRFLLLPGEEVTASWVRPKSAAVPETSASVHINIVNLVDAIAPATGANAPAIMRQTSAASADQQRRTGRAMLLQVNHPNFNWGVTAEDFAQCPDVRFFELYNGHQLSNNAGDARHTGVEALWDAALVARLGGGRGGVLYATATDDAHNWREWGFGKSNAGRGWIVVRAARLTPESLLHAMDLGDFYASTGVTLRTLERSNERCAVEIDGAPGVNYVIEFIGARRKTDGTIGLPEVLARFTGLAGEFRLRGDEVYVRARVVSSRAKENGSVDGEFESAWTQPWPGRASQGK